MEHPDDTVDAPVSPFYFTALQNKAGLNARMVENLPTGTPEKKSMLLELGGGDVPRPFSSAARERKHMIIGNIDKKPGNNGDVRLVMDLHEAEDGLNDRRIKECIEPYTLGAVVISHLTPHVRSEVMNTLMKTSAEQIPMGGRLYLIDKIAWQYEKVDKEAFERHHAAFSAMKQIATEERFKLHKWLIAPIVNYKTQKKMAPVEGKFQHLCPQIVMPFVENGEAGMEWIPDKPMTQCVDVIGNGAKCFHHHMAERIFILEKIDPLSEETRRREEARKKREADRKKKDMRKRSRR